MNYYEMMDKNIKNFLEEKSEFIACKQGCSKCCKMLPLMATPIEIDLIVSELNQLNPILKKTIKKNIDILDKKYHSNNQHSTIIDSLEKLSNFSKDQISYQCAFLVGNKCAIYNVRPELCRKYFSSDQKICDSNGTGDLVVPYNEAEKLFYKNNFPKNYIKNDLIIGHVHRNITYANGRFRRIVT